MASPILHTHFTRHRSDSHDALPRSSGLVHHHVAGQENANIELGRERLLHPRESAPSRFDFPL